MSFLQAPPDPSPEIQLLLAVKDDDLEKVTRIIPYVNPKSSSALDAFALPQAAWRGSLKMVEILLTILDPKANDSKALQWAAFYNQMAVARLLLPLSDPLALDSEALFGATEHGYEDMVRLLLPVSDPKAKDSRALLSAMTKRRNSLTSLLLPVSDPDPVFRALFRDGDVKQADVLTPLITEGVLRETAETTWFSSASMPNFQERLTTLELRDTLAQALSVTGSPPPRGRARL